MKIAVIQFPGSNCERETGLAIKRAGMIPVNFNWNEPTEKLLECDGFVIVGGFSYEDRSRAGIIAALDPVMEVLKEQSLTGKPILGICNGAQILVESGLVPGLPGDQVAMALTTNKRVAFDRVMGVGFYNAWVNMRRSDQAVECAFTSGVSTEDIMHIPVAHAEGRFMMPKALQKEIEQHGLDVYQYCTSSGEIVPDFPVNPNGSVNNIAAVVNYAGNVMAMMPHPERTKQGDAIFTAMRDYLAEGESARSGKINYVAPEVTVGSLVPEAHQLFVDAVIADNQAASVQNCLNQLNIPVIVKRYQHWEVSADDQSLEQIIQSGELYNPSKEYLLAHDMLSGGDNSIVMLVREKEDFVGQQKFQLLANHFEVNGVKHITHGIVWHLTAESGEIKEHVKTILERRILFNPVASDCFLI